ncbi:MAG: class I SAM-dependent methyltransferase [Actinobacteria bacterium]|nr:class I SAM-dependent methyltransferase [Actinomycetota bacterium]
MRKWAGRVDLVAPGDLGRFKERHITDSLRALPTVTSLPAGPGIDIGSGAGLPGIPLAIAEPSRHWRLLEPQTKRAAFLEEVVRTLELNCEVVVRRAEEIANDPAFVAAHLVVTLRAVAPPAAAFRLGSPLVAPGGAALVFLGKAAEIPPEADVVEEGIAIVRR